MKTTLTSFVLIVLLFTAMFLGEPVSSEASAPPETQTTAPKFALLVGVNEYKKLPNGISDLGGTHNDVALMKKLLVDKYGYTETPRPGSDPKAAPCGSQTAGSSVQTLCSAQATKKAILDTFDSHLVANAKKYWDAKGPVDPKKGPSVVFYYSGHGAYVNDKELVPGEEKGNFVIDEADGRDETLVPHDTDKSGVRDIRDDEFDKRISELKKYTSNILFMSDSCHSGTITRGAGKKGFERDIGVVTSSGTRGGGETSNDNLGSGTGYVTISGSLPTQFSYEDFLDDPDTKQNQRNGLLTYHFVKEVRQNENASYREIINLVRNAIGRKRDQTPQAEGDIDNGVFGSTGPKVKTPIFIDCTSKSANSCSEPVKTTADNGTESIVHRVKMKVGSVVGARVGGSIVVYGPKAKDLGDALGSGQIVSATKFTSEAEITLTGSNQSVPENSRAVLVAPNFSDEKRSVAIDMTGDPGDPGVQSMRTLASNLKANSYVAPIEASDLLKSMNARRNDTSTTATAPSWDAAVVRGTYADFKLGQRLAAPAKDAKIPVDSDVVYFITSKDGVPLYNFWVQASDPEAAGKITTALEQHVRYENIRALGNRANSMSSQVKVELVKLKSFAILDEDAPQCRATPLDSAELAKMPATPQMRSGDRFYFKITNNSEKDLLLYVYSLGTTGEITLLYPPQNARETLSKGSSVTTLDKSQCRHFYIPDGEQYGNETIKVIATETEIPADLLTMPSIMLRSGNERKGAESPLTRLLRQTASNSRNTGVNEVPASSWATVNFDYEIVP